jgi:hypothetical protein
LKTAHVLSAISNKENPVVKVSSLIRMVPRTMVNSRLALDTVLALTFTLMVIDTKGCMYVV